MIPDPVWAAPLLATIQFADAAFSRPPLWFVRECLEDVHFPRAYWWVFTPIKAAAGAGLVAGLWLPHIGTITAGALIVYFVLAVGSHIRVGDIGRNLLSATGLLVLSAFVFSSFVAS